MDLLPPDYGFVSFDLHPNIHLELKGYLHWSCLWFCYVLFGREGCISKKEIWSEGNHEEVTTFC